MKASAGLMVLGLLACVPPAAEAAGGNPRDGRRDVSYLIPVPVTEPEQIAAWLGRLSGRYRVDGSLWMLSRLIEVPGQEPIEFQQRFVPVKGAADCVSVGSGPGLQCILNISWEDQFEIIMDPEQGPPGVHNLPGGVAYLNPSMMLVGMEPNRQGITFLLVDNKGLPEGGPGSIAGARATLRASCVNAPNLFLTMRPDARFNDRYPQICERITRIDARPDAALLNVAISIEINEELVTVTELTLRRVAPDDPAPMDARRRRR